MHHQYRIVPDSQQENSFRVFAKEAPSRDEEHNKVRHLREMGWGWPSIATELRIMRSIEDDVSGGHPHDYELSADYVLTVMEPGDIVETPKRKFIVQKRGRA